MYTRNSKGKYDTHQMNGYNFEGERNAQKKEEMCYKFNHPRDLEVIFNDNSEYTFPNKVISGGPNPKTKIAPVIAPRSLDMDYWANNSTTVRSGINDQSPVDTYYSGFLTRGCSVVYGKTASPESCFSELNQPFACPLPLKGNFQKEKEDCNVYTLPSWKGQGCSVRENYKSQKQEDKQENTQENFTNSIIVSGESKAARSDFPEALPTWKPFKNQGCKGCVSSEDTKQQDLLGYAVDGVTQALIKNTNPTEPSACSTPRWCGQINKNCGYNPEQLDVDIPSNLITKTCDRNPVFTEFNKNLYTQTIQPGVYSKSEINEPIGSNIGISYQQQFLPKTYDSTKDEFEVTYRDPEQFGEIIEPADLSWVSASDRANIYDPRFTGYGPNYRQYLDSVVEQPRFYYDDVNAIVAPNYISRSNIDFATFADTSGPLNEKDRFGNSNQADIRCLANKAFENATILQRTELQERLMRKRNSEMHQLRQFPMRTGGQRMLGGSSLRA